MSAAYNLRADAEKIVRDAVAASLPDEAVMNALHGREFPGRVFLVAAGKAAWQMTAAALKVLSVPIEHGVVVTKYGHSLGALPNVDIFEAGHPVPDENGIIGCEAAIKMVSGLCETDTVLFLLSGGGSALFEKPFIPLSELQDITDQLLRRAADITEINTIRKRLSSVKGGRFAQMCKPAHVLTLILSDVLGDDVGAIASGPTVADTTTSKTAMKIAGKYGLTSSIDAHMYLMRETPKALDNSEIIMVGSVKMLCAEAVESARRLGYEPVLLTDSISCEARDAGVMLAEKAKEHAADGKNLAFIVGGETVVHVNGHGKGGRNQELALAAAPILEGFENCAVISLGSDGTDGPTDAAGAFCDSESTEKLRNAGIDFEAVMADNDAYHALRAIDGLIITGPTGTNVNDISVALVHA